MTKPKPPCRIYGIMAREAPVAVLFRRGPTKCVQVLRWDTSSDLIEPGQWHFGRLYEHGCDLSPDGRLLVYCADRYGPHVHGGYENWTAVSRPPYLTALAIWFGIGGGLFRSNTALEIGERLRSTELAGGGPGLPIELTDLDLTELGKWGLERARETRDGWVVVREMEYTEPDLGPSFPVPREIVWGSTVIEEWVREVGQWMLEHRPALEEYLREAKKWTAENRGYVTHVPRLLEKPCGQWRLQRTERYRQYTLLRDYSLVGAELDLSGVDWAEWDERGRLVFARAGKVFAATLREGQAPQIAEIADLNPNKFARVKSPDWARQW